MSSSVKKIAANRRNAKKSTGPRTKAGKQRVVLNALKHARYADPANLPGENPQETSELVKSLRESLQPQGPLEEVLFNQLISIIQSFNRIDRGYAAHLAAQINRQAVSRQQRWSIHELEEKLDTKILSNQERWTTRRQIDEIFLITKPFVQVRDLDAVLDISISDEHEVALAESMDRRKRQLRRDFDDILTQFRDLRATHRSEMIVLDPAPDANRAGVINQIEAPKRLALGPSNNDSDNNDDAGNNAQHQVMIRHKATVTIRRFAAGLEFAASFFKNKAKKYRESNVFRRLVGAIDRGLAARSRQIPAPGDSQPDHSAEASKGACQFSTTDQA